MINLFYDVCSQQRCKSAFTLALSDQGLAVCMGFLWTLGYPRIKYFNLFKDIG